MGSRKCLYLYGKLYIMFERELLYFIECQEELVKKYYGRWLVIIGRQVVADFETEEAAYYYAVSKYKPGAFMLQECLPGPEAYTIYERHRFACL